MVPLRQFYSWGRHDNDISSTQAGVDAALGAGYFEVRTEGYVYPSTRAGFSPLRLFYSFSRGDNYLAGSTAGVRAAQDAAYTEIRVEGYAIPN